MRCEIKTDYCIAGSIVEIGELAIGGIIDLADWYGVATRICACNINFGVWY